MVGGRASRAVDARLQRVPASARFPAMRRDQTLDPSPQAVFQATGPTSVILNLSTEKYYGLDEIGTRFWQLMEQHRRFGPVFDQMLREYDVEADRLEADLERLIAHLLVHRLLHLDPGGEEPKPA
jgi:hypothetical protein